MTATLGVTDFLVLINFMLDRKRSYTVFVYSCDISGLGLGLGLDLDLGLTLP